MAENHLILCHRHFPIYRLSVGSPECNTTPAAEVISYTGDIIHLDGRDTAYNAIANTDTHLDSGYVSSVDRTQRNSGFSLFNHDTPRAAEDGRSSGSNPSS